MDRSTVAVLQLEARDTKCTSFVMLAVGAGAPPRSAGRTASTPKFLSSKHR